MVERITVGHTVSKGQHDHNPALLTQVQSAPSHFAQVSSSSTVLRHRLTQSPLPPAAQFAVAHPQTFSIIYLYPSELVASKTPRYPNWKLRHYPQLLFSLSPSFSQKSHLIYLLVISGTSHPLLSKVPSFISQFANPPSRRLVSNLAPFTLQSDLSRVKIGLCHSFVHILLPL